VFFNGLSYHNFSQYDALFQIGSIKNVQEIQVPLRGTTKVFIPNWFDYKVYIQHYTFCTLLSLECQVKSQEIRKYKGRARQRCLANSVG